MLVLAANLRECTSAVVNPFVAIYLAATRKHAGANGKVDGAGGDLVANLLYNISCGIKEMRDSHTCVVSLVLGSFSTIGAKVSTPYWSSEQSTTQWVCNHKIAVPVIQRSATHFVSLMRNRCGMREHGQHKQSFSGLGSWNTVDSWQLICTQKPGEGTVISTYTICHCLIELTVQDSNATRLTKGWIIGRQHGERLVLFSARVISRNVPGCCRKIDVLPRAQIWLLTCCIATALRSRMVVTEHCEWILRRWCTIEYFRVSKRGRSVSQHQW